MREAKGAGMRRSNRWVVVVAALVGAAVVRELRQPPEQREWHGYLGGFVPYDLRPPTVERFRQSWWNPADERIFTPRDFGVGWGVNLPSLGRFLGELISAR
jgi:hypothetical protein